MNRLRLLQVCNVGEIVGGTTACAWTVTRALPEFDHTVAFLTDVSAETRAAFGGTRIERWAKCSPAAVDQHRPDIVLLHNIGGRRPMSRCAVTLQYVHSAGRRAPADVTLCCSRWLAEENGRSECDVLHQGVPRPPRPEHARSRSAAGRLIFGRLCTPMGLKWPRPIVMFYAQLSKQFPQVEWEFVGCPQCLRSDLQTACCGRARFLRAGWQARQRFWEWDALLYHHPTLTESFGRTVAEGMRTGSIPIVDARGGFLEQVTPETGFLCATGEDFAACVSRLHDAALRRRMSDAGRKHADAQFSIAAFRQRLLTRIREAARNVR